MHVHLYLAIITSERRCAPLRIAPTVLAAASREVHGDIYMPFASEYLCCTSRVTAHNFHLSNQNLKFPHV